MSTEILIFQAGAALFALASIYFLFTGENKPNFSTEFFISFITTTSYALMSQSLAVTFSMNGQPIYWSRWLFYMIACSLLMYDTSRVLKISERDYPFMVLLTWLTMFNGFLASYITSSSRWIFYILSSVAYIGLLYFVMKGEDNPEFKTIKPFVLIGWTLFPVVFILAPTGIGLINTNIAEASYLVLDVATKIIFGIQTSKIK
ncbi:schizorhodopsin|nr:schizorhodopsin [Candidatus Bathyarchaeota archaeon]